MTGGSLVACLTLGAGALALWIGVRFPGRGPQRLAAIALHLALSLVAVQAAPVVMRMLIDARESASVGVLALLGVFLPALVYVFLSALWLMRRVQLAIPR